MGCHCPKPQPLTGYIYPVMTRCGLRGLRGMGQSDAAVLVAAGPGALASAVGAPAPEATNAQGQTMADILAAGGSPSDLGPTYDTSTIGVPASQMQPVFDPYGEAMSAADAMTAFPRYIASLIPGSANYGGGSPGGFGIPWWVWAAAGAVGVVMLADVVKK